MTERSHKNDIGVGRVNTYPGDRLRLTQAHVAPCLSAVARFINAISLGDTPTKLGLSSSYKNNVRICFRDSDRTDGRAADLSVRDRSPLLATIGRFPKSAASGSEVI